MLKAKTVKIPKNYDTKVEVIIITEQVHGDIPGSPCYITAQTLAQSHPCHELSPLAASPHYLRHCTSLLTRSSPPLSPSN